MIKPTIVLLDGHFSTFCKPTDISKFHGKGQIPKLSSKFHNSQKTVGPGNEPKSAL